MKPYKRYTEITPKEAKRGDKISFYKGGDDSAEFVTPHPHDERKAIVVYSDGSASEYDHSFYRVEDVCPRDVPEGVTPLPEDKPWLAYVPRGMIVESDVGCRYWYSHKTSKGWSEGEYSYDSHNYHYAIDVRTDFAKNTHAFKDIVEAMEYTEVEEVEPFLEYFHQAKFKANYIGIMDDHKSTWEAAIKHTEGSK